MPDQPVEDGGRSLGAAARRARRASSPLTAPAEARPASPPDSLDRPTVFVVTGPSGAGKGTLIKRLLPRLPELELAVSATTRQRRPGERDGREYWFLSDEEFDAKLERGDFLEYVPFEWGQRSGTLRSEIDRIRAAGRVPVLELELKGAMTVRDEVRGSVTIFVDAPLGELERRLRERATESAGEIGKRLALARSQKTQAGEFHHVVVNDDVERAVGELEKILADELAAHPAPAGGAADRAAGGR